MTELTTSLDRRSEVFAANAAAMRGLVADLREKVATIEEGGGAEARRRHLGRGKLLPRERVRALLDPGSPFLELSQLAAYGMYDGEVPAPGSSPGSAASWAGMCVVVANDATVRAAPISLSPSKAPARPGDRRGEPAALPLSRRLGGRFAGAGTRFSDRDISERIFTIRPACRRPASCRSRSSARARGRRHVPAMSDRVSSCAGRGRSFSAGRRWSAPPPAKSSPRGARRAECTAASPALPTITRSMTATRSALPGISSAISIAPKHSGGSTALEPLYPAEDIYRHHPDRHAPTL